MSVSLQQIAKWKSRQNPLEKVLGRDSIAPTILAREQEDNATMHLVCEELKETTNLRNKYMGGVKWNTRMKKMF